MVFNCPSCHVPIGEVNTPGTADMLCPSCRYKYRILTGRLTGKSTRQITVRRQTTKQTGIYKRSYEFRLATPGNQLEVVPFEISGRDDSVLVRKGDDVSVVQSLREDTPEEMLAVLNHTTGQAFTIGTPGEKSRRSALLISIIGAVFVLLISAEAVGGGALFLAVLAGIGLYAFSVKHLAPTHTILPEQEAVLARSRTLLEQKQEMLENLQSVENDLSAKETLENRLQNLRAKMLDVGPELYRTRLELIASALRTIEQQIALDRQLITGYDKAIKMLEIELETSARTDDLPEDVIATILAKSDELAAISERNEELQRLLSANQEVERLLRSS